MATGGTRSGRRSGSGSNAWWTRPRSGCRRSDTCGRPGALPELGFLAACTRCGDCIPVCPVQAIVRAPTESGLAAGTPYLNIQVQACIACADMPCARACPTEALTVPAAWMGRLPARHGGVRAGALCHLQGRGMPGMRQGVSRGRTGAGDRRRRASGAQARGVRGLRELREGVHHEPVIVPVQAGRRMRHGA